MSRPHSQSIGASSNTSGVWASGGRGQTSGHSTFASPRGFVGALWPTAGAEAKTGREYWVDDRYATRCFSCHSKFTIVRRKHHCRDCGQVFCGDCMIVKGKDDKICHECYDSRRRGGDTARSQLAIPTSSAASPRLGEVEGGRGGGQSSSYYAPPPPASTPRAQFPISNASFGELPVLHRTSSSMPRHTPRHDTSGDALGDVDEVPHTFVQERPTLSSPRSHTPPPPPAVPTVNLYALLEDSAKGSTTLQDTLRGQDSNLLLEALHLKTPRPTAGAATSAGSADELGSTINSIVLGDVDDTAVTPTHQSVRPRIVERVELLQFDEITLSASQYEAAVQHSARAHPVRAPPRVTVTYSETPVSRNVGGASKPRSALKGRSNTPTAVPQTTSQQLAIAAPRTADSPAAHVAHRDTLMSVFHAGTLELAQPHEETAEDAECVTYGTYEPPIPSLVNPIEVFLASLKNAVRREVLGRVAPVVVEVKEKHYVPYPFVRFRHSETSPDALLYLTSFPKVEIEYPNDVSMVLERRYNTRSALLSQYWDHASGAGVTARPNNEGGGVITRTLSQRSMRKKKRFLRAAMPVHPSRRSEVSLSVLEKRCSNHLKARVEIYMQELLATDPALLHERGIDPIVDGVEPTHIASGISRASVVAQRAYGRDALPAPAPPDSAEPPPSPELDVAKVSSAWSSVICDLTWKMLSQVQVTPMALQPPQYYQHPSCLGAPALVHSGIFQHMDILTIAGSSIANSNILPGVAFVHTATTAVHTVTTQDNPRVLLLGGHVGRAPTFTGGVGVEEYLNTYPGWLEKLFSRIETWRPSVILVEHTMHHFIQGKVAEAGIALVTLVGRAVLERLERALSARLINDISKVSIAEMRDPGLNPVGTCSTYSIETLEGRPVMMFSGLPRPVFCTLILRGGSDRVLGAIKSVLTKSIVAAHHLLCLSHFCSAFKCLVGSVEGMTRLLGHRVALQPDFPSEGGGKALGTSRLPARTGRPLQRDKGATAGGDIVLTDPYSPSLPLLLAVRGKEAMDSYIAQAAGGVVTAASPSSVTDFDVEGTEPYVEEDEQQEDVLAEEAVCAQLVSDESNLRLLMVQEESLLSGASLRTHIHPNPPPSDQIPAISLSEVGTEPNEGALASATENTGLLQQLSSAAFASGGLQRQASGVHVCDCEDALKSVGALTHTPTPLAPNESLTLSFGVHLQPSARRAASLLTVSEKFLLRDNIVVGSIHLERAVPVASVAVGAVATASQYVTGFWGNTVGAVGSTVDPRASRRTLAVDSLYNGVRPSTLAFANTHDDPQAGSSSASGQLPSGAAIPHQSLLFDETDWLNLVAPATMKDPKHEKRIFGFYNVNDGDETLGEFLQDLADIPCDFTRLYLHENRKLVVRVAHEPISRAGVAQAQESFQEKVDLGECENPYASAFDMSCYTACSTCKRAAGKDHSLAGTTVSNLVASATASVSRGGLFGDESSLSGRSSDVPIPEWDRDGYACTMSSPQPVPYHLLRMSLGAYLEMALYANNPFTTELVDFEGAMRDAGSSESATDSYETYAKLDREKTSGFFSTLCGHPLFTSVRPCFEIWCTDRSSIATVTFAVEALGVSDTVGPSLYMGKELKNTAADALWKLQVRHDIFALLTGVLEAKATKGGNTSHKTLAELLPGPWRGLVSELLWPSGASNCDNHTNSWLLDGITPAEGSTDDGGGRGPSPDPTTPQDPSQEDINLDSSFSGRLLSVAMRRRGGKQRRKVGFRDADGSDSDEVADMFDADFSRDMNELIGRFGSTDMDLTSDATQSGITDMTTTNEFCQAAAALLGGLTGSRGSIGFAVNEIERLNILEDVLLTFGGQVREESDSFRPEASPNRPSAPSGKGPSNKVSTIPYAQTLRGNSFPFSCTRTHNPDGSYVHMVRLLLVKYLLSLRMRLVVHQQAAALKAACVSALVTSAGDAAGTERNEQLTKGLAESVATLIRRMPTIRHPLLTSASLTPTLRLQTELRAGEMPFQNNSPNARREYTIRGQHHRRVVREYYLLMEREELMRSVLGLIQLMSSLGHTEFYLLSVLDAHAEYMDKIADTVNQRRTAAEGDNDESIHPDSGFSPSSILEAKDLTRRLTQTNTASFVPILGSQFHETYFAQSANQGRRAVMDAIGRFIDPKDAPKGGKQQQQVGAAIPTALGVGDKPPLPPQQEASSGNVSLARHARSISADLSMNRVLEQNAITALASIADAAASEMGVSPPANTNMNDSILSDMGAPSSSQGVGSTNTLGDSPSTHNQPPQPDQSSSTSFNRNMPPSPSATSLTPPPPSTSTTSATNRLSKPAQAPSTPSNFPTDAQVANGVFTAMDSLGSTSRVIFGRTPATQLFVGGLLITPTILLEMVNNVKSIEHVGQFRRQILDPCIQELINCFFNSVQDYVYVRSHPKLLNELAKRVSKEGRPLSVTPVVPSHFPVAAIHPPPPRTKEDADRVKSAAFQPQQQQQASPFTFPGKDADGQSPASLAGVSPPTTPFPLSPVAHPTPQNSTAEDELDERAPVVIMDTFARRARTKVSIASFKDPSLAYSARYDSFVRLDEPTSLILLAIRAPALLAQSSSQRSRHHDYIMRRREHHHHHTAPSNNGTGSATASEMTPQTSPLYNGPFPTPPTPPQVSERTIVEEIVVDSSISAASSSSDIEDLLTARSRPVVPNVLSRTFNRTRNDVGFTDIPEVEEIDDDHSSGDDCGAPNPRSTSGPISRHGRVDTFEPQSKQDSTAHKRDAPPPKRSATLNPLTSTSAFHLGKSKPSRANLFAEFDVVSDDEEVAEREREVRADGAGALGEEKDLRVTMKELFADGHKRSSRRFGDPNKSLRASLALHDETQRKKSAANLLSTSQTTTPEASERPVEDPVTDASNPVGQPVTPTLESMSPASPQLGSEGSPHRGNPTTGASSSGSPLLLEDPFHIKDFDHAIDILLGKEGDQEDEGAAKRGASRRAKARLFEFTDTVTVSDDSSLRYLSGIVNQAERAARGTISGAQSDFAANGPQINPHAVGSVQSAPLSDVVSQRLNSTLGFAPLTWAQHGLEMAANAIDPQPNKDFPIEASKITTAEEMGSCASVGDRAATLQGSPPVKRHESSLWSEVGADSICGSPSTTQPSPTSIPRPGRGVDLVDGFLPSKTPRKTVTVNTAITKRVSVEVLFPYRFAALRYLYSGGCPDDLLVSLLRCMDFTPGSGQSHKRGKSFYKTRDERFILKQVKQVELQHFLEFGPAYFNHMAQVFLEEREATNAFFGTGEATDARYARTSVDGASRPPGSIRTLLAKTLGVFSVTTFTLSKDDRRAAANPPPSAQAPSASGSTAATDAGGSNPPASNGGGGGSKEVKFFILMDNFLCRTSPARSFDLKGSQMNRMAAVGRKESYMDENLVNRMKMGYFLFVKEEDKSWIKNVLSRDAEMLAKQRVMDYSLVVGVDGSVQEEEVTRAEDQRVAATGGPAGDKVPSSAPMALDAGLIQPLLYLGVIDYLHPYTFPKLMETRLKRLAGRIGGVASGAEADKLIPTIIEPPQYLTRFMKYMDAYFCGVPTKTSQVKRLLATKAALTQRAASGLVFPPSVATQAQGAAAAAAQNPAEGR